MLTLDKAARYWRPAAGAIALGGLLLAERLMPLRQRRRAQGPRLARNALLGAMCQAVILVSERPLTSAIARRNAARRRGLQHLVGARFGRAAGALAALLVMDYTFYLWHVATHKAPFLWRFHRVHHVDPDLDASTAIRFHFIDMLVSLPWRLAQVRLAGLDPAMLARWQAFFIASISFHHANWRLPGRWDERLSYLLTTPRMHGIHHSRVQQEMDSNWTSGLSFWDRLHGTFCGDVAQQAIVIGVDDRMAAGAIPLGGALLAPLRAPPRVPTLPRG